MPGDCSPCSGEAQRVVLGVPKATRPILSSPLAIVWSTNSGVSLIIPLHLAPSVNMPRLHPLSLENSLFGNILLVRTWGRIGAHGRVRFGWFDDPTNAANELTRIATVKARRGDQEYGPKAESAGSQGPRSARHDRHVAAIGQAKPTRPATDRGREIR
jgi:predicted DNA-binding WGR domain protein